MSLIATVISFFKPVPLRIRFCRIQPLYSELFVYAWQCKRCGHFEFGKETQKPTCTNFKKGAA